MKKIIGLLVFLLPFCFLVGCMKKDEPNNDTAPAVKKEVQRTLATIETNFGSFKVKFYDADAPKTVANFVKLSEEGFYDGILFHRVIKDFMVQAGDPLSKQEDWNLHGKGGPGYTFEDEFNQHKLVSGTMAMANAGPNTNGSQFFVVTAESTPWLDGKHTAFGEVVYGMDVVDKIENVRVNEMHHPVKEDEIVILNITIEK